MALALKNSSFSARCTSLLGTALLAGSFLAAAAPAQAETPLCHRDDGQEVAFRAISPDALRKTGGLLASAFYDEAEIRYDSRLDGFPAAFRTFTLRHECAHFERRHLGPQAAGDPAAMENEADCRAAADMTAEERETVARGLVALLRQAGTPRAEIFRRLDNLSACPAGDGRTAALTPGR